METIFEFMHKLCSAVAFLVTLVLLDLPLKILSWVFLLILGCILCIIYPLIKDHEGCNFIEVIYDYANSKQLIARWVWKQWQY